MSCNRVGMTKLFLYAIRLSLARKINADISNHFNAIRIEVTSAEFERLLQRNLPEVRSSVRKYLLGHPNKHRNQDQQVCHTQLLQISVSKSFHLIQGLGCYIRPSKPEIPLIEIRITHLALQSTRNLLVTVKPLRQRYQTFCVAGTRNVGTLTFLPCRYRYIKFFIRGNSIISER